MPAEFLSNGYASVPLKTAGAYASISIARAVPILCKRRNMRTKKNMRVRSCGDVSILLARS